jgi:hypothetical protein
MSGVNGKTNEKQYEIWEQNEGEGPGNYQYL